MNYYSQYYEAYPLKLPENLKQIPFLGELQDAYEHPPYGERS